MTDNEQSEKDLWSYVRNEMPSDERRAFERLMASDDAFRKRVEDAAYTETYVKTLFHFSTADEATIEGAIIQAWEASDEAEGIRSPGDNVAQKDEGHIRPRPHRTLWFSAWGLAAAASLMLALGLSNYLSPSLTWRAHDIAAFSARGVEEGEAPGVYDADTLREFASVLQDAIQSAYERRWPAAAKRSLFKRRRELSIVIRCHETWQGVVSVEVEAYAQGATTPTRTWRESLKAGDVSLATFEDLGSQIVEDLGVMKKRER